MKVNNIAIRTIKQNSNYHKKQRAENFGPLSLITILYYAAHYDRSRHRWSVHYLVFHE